MKHQGLLSALILLIVVLLFKQFLLPQWQDFVAARVKFNEVLKELEIHQKIQDVSLTKKLDTPEVTSKIEKLNLILPKVFNQDLYIETISNIASINSLLLENIEVQLDSASPPGNIEMRRAFINLTLSGSYNNFNKFLVSIKDNLTIFEVTEFSVNRLSGESALGQDNFRFSLKILTYISL
ncbi:MAG: hypothetical protein ABIJ94_00415 [candidate division WOR-3 bacterium]